MNELPLGGHPGGGPVRFALVTFRVEGVENVTAIGLGPPASVLRAPERRVQLWWPKFGFRPKKEGFVMTRQSQGPRVTVAHQNLPGEPCRGEPALSTEIGLDT